MDYQFRRDLRSRPEAIFSMGHEAFSGWFSEELGGNLNTLNQLLTAIEQLSAHRRWEFVLPGSEYQLSLNRDQAEVRATALGLEQPSFDREALSLYDDEQQACCGLDDFRAALLAWQQFVAAPRG